MDIYCTAHRNNPFVDDRCYPRICFGCFWTPKTVEQIYDKDGFVLEERHLPFSHKNLHTPEELFKYGMCDTLEEAVKCVRGVKKACKDAGLDGRTKGKPKSKPQNPQVELL